MTPVVLLSVRPLGRLEAAYVYFSPAAESVEVIVTLTFTPTWVFSVAGALTVTTLPTVHRKVAVPAGEALPSVTVSVTTKEPDASVSPVMVPVALLMTRPPGRPLTTYFIGASALLSVALTGRLTFFVCRVVAWFAGLVTVIVFFTVQVN